MIAHVVTGRCPRLRRLVCLPFVLLFAAPLAAQDPPLPDTLRVDTLSVDTPRATLLFPAMPTGTGSGPMDAVWVWDRQALLREAPLSLIDLFNRIPGVTAMRAGMFVQPEAASVFGGTAGRVEIEVDGFTVDPLAGNVVDLSAIPLGQLREVRVERRLGLLRIRLLTDQPTEPDIYSRVEAGVGQPPANMFRGLFLAPHVIAGPLGVGIERVDTDGLDRAAPANVFNGWAKWAWVSGPRGVQAEMMRSTLRREPQVPWPTDRVRQDLVVRARNAFLPGLIGELYLGRSTLEEEPWTAATDTAEVPRVERDATQAGARIGWRTAHVNATGALRLRSAELLARSEARIDAETAAGPARVAAHLARSSFDGGGSATAWDLAGRLTAPFGGSVFAELTGGRRGIADYRAGTTIFSDRSGWRVGAGLTLGDRASGSIALIDLEQSPALPFGLPFDTLAPAVVTGPARGFEAAGRLRLYRDILAVESWFTDWSTAAGWTYLPVRTWRTVLELHTLPLPSGNLEILGRLEGMHRSGMLAFNPEPPLDDEDDYSPVTGLPAFTLFNGYIQIRVIDVRIFLRWEDLLGNTVEDLPGRFHRGPRIFYGVKWDLWN